MADKDYKAFIVEGEAREPQVIDNISKVFFKHGNFKIITLPAGENIYKIGSLIPPFWIQKNAWFTIYCSMRLYVVLLI